jgi:hypothetical protein
MKSSNKVSPVKPGIIKPGGPKGVKPGVIKPSMKMGGSAKGPYGDLGISAYMTGKPAAKSAYQKLGNTKPAMKMGGKTKK